MACLQRLIIDEKCGFNYDSMGYAEFEFGATALARSELAEFTLDKTIHAKRVRFIGTYGVTKIEFPAVMIGEKAFLETIGVDLKVTMEKTLVRNDDPKILGWMNVGRGQHKFILFRDDKNFSANVDRLEKFLDPFVKQAEEERAAA